MLLMQYNAKFVTIMKTEQTTIVYTQWGRWISHDVIRYMITTDVILK